MTLARRKNQGNLDAAMESLANAFQLPEGDETTTVSVSGTAAEATGLTPYATYRVWCDVVCYILADASADATATTAYPLSASVGELVTLPDVTRLSVITGGGSGTLSLTRMG